MNEFSEKDVDALGDNVVTILNTVKNLTQPEIMAMTNNAVQAMQEDTTQDQRLDVGNLARPIRSKSA